MSNLSKRFILNSKKYIVALERLILRFAIFALSIFFYVALNFFFVQFAGDVSRSNTRTLHFGNLIQANIFKNLTIHSLSIATLNTNFKTEITNRTSQISTLYFIKRMEFDGNIIYTAHTNMLLFTYNTFKSINRHSLIHNKFHLFLQKLRFSA